MNYLSFLNVLFSISGYISALEYWRFHSTLFFISAYEIAKYHRQHRFANISNIFQPKVKSNLVENVIITINKYQQASYILKQMTAYASSKTNHL